MVFFMVFVARCRAESIDTMKENQCWYGIGKHELRVAWSNP
jgi:hypothetical protein